MTVGPQKTASDVGGLRPPAPVSPGVRFGASSGTVVIALIVIVLGAVGADRSAERGANALAIGAVTAAVATAIGLCLGWALARLLGRPLVDAAVDACPHAVAEQLEVMRDLLTTATGTTAVHPEVVRIHGAHLERSLDSLGLGWASDVLRGAIKQLELDSSKTAAAEAGQAWSRDSTTDDAVARIEYVSRAVRAADCAGEAGRQGSE